MINLVAKPNQNVILKMVVVVAKADAVILEVVVVEMVVPVILEVPISWKRERQQSRRT